MFPWIERRDRGQPPKQMKLAAGLGPRKDREAHGPTRGLAAVFRLTGFTFVGSTPIRELGGSLVGFALGPWEAFWVLFYGFATSATLAGCASKCVCTCARTRVSRAQCSTPKDTLIISYDQAREASHARACAAASSTMKSQATRATAWTASLRVQVCPTGIDIRNGLQFVTALPAARAWTCATR